MLRELLWMFDGRQLDRWNHTSVLQATIVNTAMTSKRRKVRKPLDFHPLKDRFRQAQKNPLTSEQKKQRLWGLVGIQVKGEG